MVAVVLVAVAADRAAAAVVEHRVAARLVCLAGARARADVTVESFPVLTQLLSRRLSHVHATVDHITDGGVTVTGLVVDARDVAVPGGSGSATVGTLDVSFDVPYSALPQTANGTAISYAADRDGLLSVTARIGFGVAGLPVSVLVRPMVSGRTLTVQPVEVEALGMRQPAEQWQEQIAPYVPRQELPELPPGLAYRSVTAAPAGLRVTLAGRDVPTDTAGGAGGSPAACRA